MTEQERQELMGIVRELSYEERDVTLASGRKSNFYFDGKQTTLHCPWRIAGRQGVLGTGQGVR